MASAFLFAGIAGCLETMVDGSNTHVDPLDWNMLYIIWVCMLWYGLQPIRSIDGYMDICCI